MAKNKVKKPRRARAETPRGFRDYFGQDVVARSEMLSRITEVYYAHGFDPLETSAVETVEALGKFLPDVDRPNEGVFAWEDGDEGWMALRYDLTAPLARAFAQHRRDLPNPYRRYAVGPVWRNEKLGPGRFRQFYQCDADTVGSASVAADAEICGMLAEALEAAGIDRKDYVIRVNNRKVMNGVLESAGLLDPDDPSKFADQRGIVMRAIDKIDRLGREGVMSLLSVGRTDESGDWTPGAKLSSEQQLRIMEFISLRKLTGNFAALDALVEKSVAGKRGVEELDQIEDLVRAKGHGSNNIVIDPSVVRGLGYYTGPVFEAELTFEIFDEKGRKRQFGSVAGGGRYDDLITRFTGEKVPGTGVSVGVDRLLAALKAKGRLAKQGTAPVVVTVMDKDRMADYQAIAAKLRAAKIRAEVFLGGGSMTKQLKYADQRGSPVAIVQGGNELERGVVQVKDLVLGAKLAGNIQSNEDWKAQPAQEEIPQDDIVAHVRAVLDRNRV